jgi:hypothetical protein
MSDLEKIALGIVSIGMATALLLPGRQTIGVIDAAKNLFTGSLQTAIQG